MGSDGGPARLGIPSLTLAAPEDQGPARRAVIKERDMTETAHGTKGHSPVPAAQQDTATVRPADLDTLSPNSGQRNGSETTRPADQHDDRSEFERHLDGISLQRALIDFDVANARVIDLTHRYVEAIEEIKRLRHDLE